MIEKSFDVSFVADLALREKQIQQNYRPIIAVHKWFARRPGTLFRSLLLSEFARGELRETFFKSNSLAGIRIADPFMGGGTPLIEANRAGCDTIGYDINPMAYWVVRQTIEHLDLAAYRDAAYGIVAALEEKIGHLYRTRCLECGSTHANVKYFIWVKTQKCSGCGGAFDLFPGYLLAENRRHPMNVIVCASCGGLNEVEDRRYPGACRECGTELRLRGPANRNRCACPHCGRVNFYPTPQDGPPTHRLVAIEYYCPTCKIHHRGRFFKSCDHNDLQKYEAASESFAQLGTLFIPHESIPPGDETDRLIRWGYRQYREMFNARQLLALELSCRAIAEHSDERIRDALATNLSDLLRYQNMLCRYDTVALKSLDIFSVHGFPVGLVQCESNFLGIPNGGVNVGSGGWSNIIEKYTRAKFYCEHPFEIQHRGRNKIPVPIRGEWIGTRRADSKEERLVKLFCDTSTSCDLGDATVDAVFTDPPYLANVQYAELMDFCYVWLRRLVRDKAFDKSSTRDENELTANLTMERGIIHFTDGLIAVFRRMARALKRGRPLAFTYHHNSIDAYFPLAVAILDAKIACTASIPCPAEMGASIHINGTESSIIDTVFVCRSTGSISRRLLVSNAEGIADLVRRDLEALRAGNVRLARGDIRCVAYGHLVRMAIWELRKDWSTGFCTSEKLKAVAQEVERLGGWAGVAPYLSDELLQAPRVQVLQICEEREACWGEDENDEVSF